MKLHDGKEEKKNKINAVDMLLVVEEYKKKIPWHSEFARLRFHERGLERELAGRGCVKR